MDIIKMFAGGERKAVRLGFWNRLAVVMTGLALMIVPIGMMVLMFNDMGQTVSALYDFCNKRAENAPVLSSGDYYTRCNNEMSAGYHRASDAAYSLNTWFEFATGTLFVCAILYVFIWLAARIARWVRAGREPHQEN